MNRRNNNSQQIILAIESSCDDTSAAVVIDGKICSNVVASQEIHAEFGGVVPEWASRKHQANILPVVKAALTKASIDKSNVSAIACTQGPGLLGSLLVGYTFAKGFALANSIPLINVNHIDAHVYAHFIENPDIELPFLCLLVSGGHTELVLVNEEQQLHRLGRTIDDAAGEAFDKSGKLLGLPYPCGPLIDKHAQSGDPSKFTFSTSKLEGLDFSFSGLKTSILYFLQKEVKRNPNFIEKNLNDLCASIQTTIVSYLMSKTQEAILTTQVNSIGIAGGVAANSELRQAITDLATANKVKSYIPAFEYCTDNAGMIGYAGWLKHKNNEYGTLSDVCYTRI